MVSEDAEFWEHVATGNRYTTVCSGRLEKDGSSGQKYIVYRDVRTKFVWIRPASEFFDGRFRLLPEEP